MNEKVVFGYVRVSSAGQVEKDGPKRQEEAITQFCQLHQLAPPRFQYSDLGVSGTVEGLNRPGLVGLLGAAEFFIRCQDDVIVVVEKLDRFARDLIVSELLMRELRSRNIALYAVDQGPVDLATADADPSRKLIRQIFSAMAEYEKSALVVKLKVARERKKRETGKCDGARGFGCDSKATSGKSERIVLNLIQTLREGVDTGAASVTPQRFTKTDEESRGRGVTWRAIATMFNATGIKNRRGVAGNWTHSQLIEVWHRHLERQKKQKDKT